MNKFFTAISPFVEGMELSFTLKKSGDTISVSVAPSGHEIFEDHHIPPVVVSGTASELDEGFVDAIIKPVQKVQGLIVKTEAFDQAVEKASTESKPNQDKKPEVKKDSKADEKAKKAEAARIAKEEKERAAKLKAERKTKLDALVKRAYEEEKSGRYKSAIGLLNEAKDFAESTEGLQKNIDNMIGILERQGFYSPEALKEFSAFKSEFAKEMFHEVEVSKTIEPATTAEEPSENILQPEFEEVAAQQNAEEGAGE